MLRGSNSDCSNWGEPGQDGGQVKFNVIGGMDVDHNQDAQINIILFPSLGKNDSIV